MKCLKTPLIINAFLSASVLLFLISPAVTQAAVTVSGPPIDVLSGNENVGGGAFIPLIQFNLTGDGNTTLTNVKVAILSTTTPFNLNNGEVNKLYLYKESGTQMGFQPTQDALTNTGANVVTDPATSTAITITVDIAYNPVAAAPTDYYIVAKATTSAALVNGHALYATTTAGWITTSGGAIGTEFVGSRKAIFQQTANIKISEVKQGATGNAGDEFVELYNASETPIDLSVLPLNLYIYNANGGAATSSFTYFKTIIPKQGFFLIASQTGYSGSTPVDATYSTADINLLINAGLSIATSSVLTKATSSAIDRIWWGAVGQATNGEGTQLANLAVDKSYERKATSDSTAGSMVSGGADSGKGNSQDSNGNSVDFVLQDTSVPQNALSPSEFPFGGGGQDNEKPRVIGSFPASNMTGVPIDMSFIGFGFNKVVRSGTIVSATATTTVTLTTGGGSNLCSSVTYNEFPSNYEPPAKCIINPSALPLSASATYSFIATSTILDLTGNALDQDPFTAGNQAYSMTFTTGVAGQTMTNITPPRVLGTTPFPGSSNIPTNLAKIFVRFSQAMNSSTLNSTSITLSSSGGSVTLSGFSYDATTTTVSFVPSSLSASVAYTLTIGSGAMSSNSIPLPGPYITMFNTASGADSSAPTVIGVVPATGQTLTLNSVDFVFFPDDHLDSSTATSGAVTLSSGGNNLPGTVSYDPMAKEGRFTATNLLPTGVSDLTLTLKGGALKNISGTQITVKTFTWSTASSNTDATPPQVLFANADNFGIAITFNEAVKSTDATTLANYSLTVAGSAITLSSMAGHSVSYDQSRRTAEISGLMLSPSSSFTVSVNNVADISNNAITTASTFTGTVQSMQASMGMLGPGEFSGDFGPKITNFSSAGIGFMPGMKVMPMNAFVSASTTYGFELPISQNINSSGKIVITFPQSSDFGLCCAVYTDSTNPFVTNQNTDINGPGDNTVGFSAIVKDPIAKTVTLTLNAATNSGGYDFLRFAVVDIKNPSVPKGKDSSGYALDIKTKNAAGTLLESFTSSPLYIGGGAVSGSATTTIRGTVSGRGTGLVGVSVRMGSPLIGMLSAVTNSAGLYQFTNVPANDQVSSFGTAGTEYMLFTDPILSGISDVNGATTTAFFGESMPTPVRATSTSIITRDFSLTATSSAINFTVKLTGDNSANGIFTSGEKLDVFAGGPGKFMAQTYTTVATNYSETAIMLVPIPQVNGSWGIGVGPSMPKMMGNMNFGPPPAPNWAVPKPIEVIVSGCPSSCVATINGSTATSYTFTVSAANRTIAGILKDGSGNYISSAEVFAFSPGQGIGNRAQTSSAGVFSIKVAAGSYNVGAFVPGVGRSREVTVVVDSSGNVYADGSATVSTGSSGSNPFNLTIKKSSYTITGSVSDGTNAVSNAPVFAYRTDAPGHIDAMTDSSGNYTLYVDSGSWRVNAYIPGFGPMSEQTVTITTASQSNINFSPSSATTYRTISGIVFESTDSSIATSTEGISQVIVRVSGTNGTNETITGSDGSFSLRVPSGTYSFTDIFKPGYGRIAPVDHALAAITSVNATADVYKAIRVNSRNTVQVVVKDSDGNALSIPKAFIDLFDATINNGNHAEITNGTSTTIQIATGTTPTIRVFVQGVPPTNVSVASDNTGITTLSSGAFTVDNSTEYIKIVVNTSAAALSTISGKIYAGSASSGNELADAWVQFVDPTNNVHFGTQATSSGVYVLQISNGTYQVQAMKPGYISAPTSLTVSGSTSSANIVVIQAASSISGTVTAGGSSASGAFVWAEKLGGGFAATKTNTAGVFSLSVDSGQWRVHAAAEGYQKAAYSSNPVNAGATGVSIALSTTASGISSKTVTSNTFTDTSSGSFSDSDVGVKVSLDSGSLGSSGSSAYLSAKETSNLPESLDTNIIGDKGVDIDATNGSSAVTNLQSGKEAEVTLTYTVAELAADGIDTISEVGILKVVSWSDDTKAWESLTTVSTYKDSSGNAIASPSDLSSVATVEFTTAEASHFSEYALSAPSNANAPATPSGLSVTQSDTVLSVTLTWTANTENDLSGYFLYRDTSSGGTFPLLANVGNVTSYTNSGLTQGTTYLYKVSAYDTDNNESAASGAVTITIQARGGGGTIFSGGGGGGGSSATVATPAPATKAVPKAAAVAKPSAVAQLVSPVFNKNLILGSRGEDVKRLQELLKQDKDIYPEGTVSGYFGAKTVAAVKRFQLKYKISPVGSLGPKTRAKLKEVFGAEAAVSKHVITTPLAVPETPALSGAEREAKITLLKEQIKLLQTQLLQMQVKLLQENIQKYKK